MNVFRNSCIVSLALAAVGCVAQPGVDDDFGDAEAAITRAPATDRDA